MKTTRVLAAGVFVGVGLLAGCGAKETPAPTPSAGTAAPPGSNTVGTGTTAGTTGGTTAGTIKKAGCTTDIAVVNAAAEETAGIKDGTIQLATAWADEGPHPDNTVDYDKTLDVALAEFTIPKDPQFGYSIPIGDPKAPDGKVYVAFSLTATDGKIQAGQTFVDTTSDQKGDGTVNPYFMYAGSTRLLPGDATITITELTDDYVCGTIGSTTKTSLQSFVGVEGTFKATRIQSLEAKEKK